MGLPAALVRAVVIASVAVSGREGALALECGFRPVHLGPSRPRTETAALAAVAAVYFHYCGDKGM